MQGVILLKGIPASGKTTYANVLLETSSLQFKRINKDDLRAMLDGSSWSKDKEKFIIDTRDHIILQSLKQGYSVIIDDTNLHIKHENRIRDIITHYSNYSGKMVQFSIKWFHIDIYTAIERDKKRAKKVGEKVIKDMQVKYLKIKNKEDRDELIFPTYGKLAQDETLPKAVIVDIDGTLAEMDGRGPFDWHRVIYDKPKMPIINLVKIIQKSERKIVFFSGRDSVCMVDTLEWLKRYFDFDIELYMRKQNDNRKDTIIKTELYQQHIVGRYCVDFALDDRDQIVDLYRNELGLTCLQVAPGNF